MNLTLPVYVEERRHARDTRTYDVRPLFAPRPQESHWLLPRALRRLTRELRRELGRLGRKARHDELTALVYAPDFEERTLKLDLELRRRTLRCRFLFVLVSSLGRRMAFSPSLPRLWFSVDRGASLETRAREVLTAHFRALEAKEALEDALEALPRDRETVGIPGRAFVTTVELEVSLEQKVTPPKQQRFAALGGGGETLHGAEELQRVGRCLDWLYPDDLRRAILRDAEVEELTQILNAREARPVLLVGRRGVGKTAIVHEYVARTVAARKRPYATKQNTWLVAPQRLISGMSFVGQWEERVLAILKVARKRRHILYFDDLLGLYQAGLTSDSELSVAHVLKPRIERREVRVLAEMSPAELRVFQELDRGFADLFHVIRVDEPGEADTLRILIRFLRELEGEERCRFALDALPSAIELQRSFVRETCFPGKAADFLQRLAVKRRGLAITRREVLQEFQEQTGLSVSFLDQRQKLRRREVLAALRRDLVGQDAAVEALADVVVTAKARLNDPERPLAAFLFLGPTGVGKTWCAKTVARYLFGSEERLLRFDMNEMVNAGSVARLVGTFRQPDGLLTGALRRQPFSVVLLDEIEKADPEVFDLLLQVLGEGRLTDARGRTADFSNAIVIMTSNLGVREAESELGFVPGDSRAAAVYVQAAERFFRPELFNRIDRVLPFTRLDREEVGRIARQLVGGVLARDGFVRRKCSLEIHPAALERVIDAGYHPELGARALRRAMEQQLTGPAAARLASLDPSVPMVVSLYPGAEGIAVQVQDLGYAGEVGGHLRSERSADPAVLAGLLRAAERLEAGVADARPPGTVSSAGLDAAGRHYYAVREQAREVREWVARLREQLETQAEQARGHYLGSRGVQARAPRRHRIYGDRPDPATIFAAEDLRDYLLDLSRRAAPEAGPGSLDEVRDELALLGALARSQRRAAARRQLLLIEARDTGTQVEQETLLLLMQGLAHSLPGTEVQLLDDARALLGQRGRACLLEGPAVDVVLRPEVGTHLFFREDRALIPLQLELLPLEPEADPLGPLRARAAARQAWLDRLVRGDAAVSDDPTPLGPVLRLYDPAGVTLDLRTGVIVKQLPDVEDLRRVLLALLPEPEWEEQT